MRFPKLLPSFAALTLSISACAETPEKSPPPADNAPDEQTLAAFNHASACTMVSTAVVDGLSRTTETDEDTELFRKLSDEIKKASLEDFKKYATALKLTPDDIADLARKARAEITQAGPEAAVAFLYTDCSDYASPESVAAFAKRLQEMEESVRRQLEEEQKQQEESVPLIPLSAPPRLTIA